MTDRVKYIVYSLLDFALTFGGTAAVIVANYLDKNSGAGYKLALSGVVLAVAVLLSAKALFEKTIKAGFMESNYQFKGSWYQAEHEQKGQLS